MNEQPDQLTRLIDASARGDDQARGDLFKLVYEQLRTIAAQARHVGAPGQTLQATALANEAFILLSNRFPAHSRDSVTGREAFYRTVAQAMRMILRDYWRAQRAQKRGGGDQPNTLDAAMVAAPNESDLDAVDFLSLDEAMNRLEQTHPRWFDVVMSRYFAGRTIDETAELLGTSRTTVKVDWQLARAWLHREIGGASA